jgi:hypothetical protein
MSAIVIVSLSAVGVTFIVAAAAVLIARLAVYGSASTDRMAILLGIAQVIKAIRGRN